MRLRKEIAKRNRDPQARNFGARFAPYSRDSAGALTAATDCA
jgi:hypothetical protein